MGVAVGRRVLLGTRNAKEHEIERKMDERKMREREMK